MSSHVNYPNVAFRSHVKDGTTQACGLLSPPVGPKWVELILHRKIIISLKDLKLSPTGLKSTQITFCKSFLLQKMRRKSQKRENGVEKEEKQGMAQSVLEYKREEADILIFFSLAFYCPRISTSQVQDEGSQGGTDFLKPLTLEKILLSFFSQVSSYRKRAAARCNFSKHMPSSTPASRSYNWGLSTYHNSL